MDKPLKCQQEKYINTRYNNTPCLEDRMSGIHQHTTLDPAYKTALSRSPVRDTSTHNITPCLQDRI